MSRSYKKTPGFVAKKIKFMKRQANKRVRRAKNVSNGSSYKKLFCSYDICDYKFLEYTKEQLENALDRLEARGYSRTTEFYKFHMK